MSEWKPRVEFWPITKPVPYSRNTKSHPTEQVQKLAASIHAAGFVQPILVDKDGVIIAGHGRHLAAQQLGHTEVPVIIADHLDETAVRTLRIADNRLNESAWDSDMLRFELGALKELNVDLNLVGFDNIPELNRFFENGEIVDGLFDSSRHTPGTPVYDEPKEKSAPEDKEAHLKTCPNCGVAIDV